jgi:hypothetical protein
MRAFADVTVFRESPEAVEFARRWIDAQRANKVTSEWHMNLLAWALTSPFHALGIVLNLIDLTIASDEAQVSEMVALGPVEWLVENSTPDFAEVLREAVVSDPGFELFTRGKRSYSDDPRWARLNGRGYGAEWVIGI